MLQTSSKGRMAGVSAENGLDYCPAPLFSENDRADESVGRVLKELFG